MGLVAAPFEWKYKVSAGPGHHGKAVPVCTEDSDLPGADPIHCKDIKASIPIQGIICLLEVQKNLEEDRLPHGHKLLEKLGLKGSGLYSLACPEPVQQILKLDVWRESAVQEAGNCLPHYLHQNNTLEVSACYLGNQDDFMSRSILGHRPIRERFLHNGNYLHPVGGIRCVVPIGRNQPLVDVFRSHSQWAA